VIPVGFAAQPQAPVNLTVPSCDVAGTENMRAAIDDTGARFQVGILPHGKAKVASFRIGRVYLFEPRGSTLNVGIPATATELNSCGATLADIFVAEPKSMLNVRAVWLYVAEVVFADGTRWSVGSADEEALLQKELATATPR